MNEEENLDFETSPEEIEGQAEQQKEEKSNATNTKIVTTGAKAAANYFAPGVGGQVVDIASKTKIGNDILNAGGQALTTATKAMPFGGQIQDTLNKADDAGAIDMASNALDMAGGGANATGAAGVAGNAASAAENSASSLNNLGSSSSLDSLNDSSSIMGSKSGSSKGLGLPVDLNVGPMKYLKYYGIGAALAFILIAIMMLPNTTLNLTDNENGAIYANNNNNLMSEEQIENSLIYVGDSRIEGMRSALNKNQINYIAATGKGYDWLNDTARTELSAYISANTQKFVVMSFGINDLANIEKYIVIYNGLINGYSNVKFYFMSVNPVNEELIGTVTNAQIESFNQRLSSAFGDQYIDVYSVIKDSFESDDGLHYSSSTYQKIHDIVVKHIRQRNSITFLGEYPKASESKILEGISITDAIGQDGIDTLNNFINAQIDAAGRCTGPGVAGAAVGLIYGLHQQGYHVAYYWGGGHGYNKGVDLKWGTNVGLSVSRGNNLYYYGGLDCSGFVAWAMNTAGVSGGTVAHSYVNYGSEITFEQASPGDLLVSSTHVIMVIENKGTYLQCAESTGGGVQFTTKTQRDLTSNKYKIIDVDEYYQSHCTHA